MIDFADIEATLNGAVQNLLANATLSYSSGIVTVEVDGIFNDSREAPDAIGTPRAVRNVTFSLTDGQAGCDDLPYRGGKEPEHTTLVAGTVVAIRGLSYTVSRIERDKTGWVVLHLRGGAA